MVPGPSFAYNLLLLWHWLLILSGPFILALLTIYPIGGVDFLPSLRPPDRRFVETRTIHLTGTTMKNILEPQISITPGPHNSV
jgi:hypothetical protein